ncbi:Ribonuclease P/MRP, subunit POP1 [Moelleriella libera RCEF 2490]|uniref:Ribonuclease P/MRP, subunit POP1 n=1 Tax=Moelleriella libera RCEF 2490 TaxID=1081109 RepID=A0A167XTT5_9HYPO|nr:Ribonuclease P/MRP, subunit POP1 [Moelleriella libera RCEF 2490]
MWWARGRANPEFLPRPPYVSKCYDTVCATAARKPAQPDMAPKPPKGHAKGNGGTDAVRQKRAKVFAARAIPAQPADAALKDGELDLQAFLAAHEFEVRSLEDSMARSKAVSASRAFQQVPRGLRRRTASHNPKRVPRRLRWKARKEMKEDNTPTVEARKRKPRTTRARIRAETAKRLGLLAARRRRRLLARAEAARKEGKADAPEPRETTSKVPRPKIRRNQLNVPPKAVSRFRKRQLNKTWLPTHKWHAKRARMTEPTRPLWRFAIPLTPNEKIYRPTHRAQGERGTMLWDTSYISTIGLYGKPASIERVIKAIGVTAESCWNEKGRKWRLGSRAWTGSLYRELGGQTRLIGPATLVWNPEARAATADDAPADAGRSGRQLYIRLSPAAFLETFNELVRLCKTKGSGVHVEDLRFEIGSITLAGPASTETLSRILTPFHTEARPKSKHASLFESIKSLTNPALLPANAVLGFSVQDPRLRFPPRKAQTDSAADMENALMDLLAEWPAEERLEPYELFDRTARFQATCLPSQKAIYKRKSLAAPGTALKLCQNDPPIPVILIASRSPSSLQAQGTWTLLMPWKCILPVWYSAVHCPLVSGGLPRFGGLNEMKQVSFERGIPWFPTDFPATSAGADYEVEQREERLKQYNRQPKSKRVEFAALDLGAGRKGEVGDGLACDFEVLFGLPRLPRGVAGGDEPELVQADDKAGDAMDVDAKHDELGYVPVESVTRKASWSSLASSSLRCLNPLSRADFDALASSSSSTGQATKNGTPSLIPLPPNALLTVRITLLARGVVKACARIYALPAPPVATVPASPSAEVPASLPPPLPSEKDTSPQQLGGSSSSSSSSSSGSGKHAKLPHDLRAQWLARVPSRQAGTLSSPEPSCCEKKRKREKATSLESRRRQLAQELLNPPEAYPPAAANQLDLGGHHALVPNADCLMGFITTGSYCLRDGKSAAFGSIAADRALQEVRQNGKQQGRLCIVRNAGEQVGWIARWDTI